MPRFEKLSDSKLFALVFGIVLLTRLPFLGPGFGVDADAWRLALAARHFAEQGHYTLSRAPGFPVVELAFAALIPFGPWALCLATAVMSAAAAGFFALLMRRLDLQMPALAAIAMAMTPTFYINSVVAMDYVWAVAFGIAAMERTTCKRPIAAGILLALATGCRATSIGFILPMIFLNGWNSRQEIGRLSILLLATGAAGALAWLPVFLVHGFPPFPDPGDHFPSRYYIVKLVLDLLGTVGIAAWSFAQLLEQPFPGKLRKAKHDGTPSRAAFAGLAVFFAVFLLIPHEAGYLLPIVPFLLILGAMEFPRRTFTGICLALIISPWLGGIGLRELPWTPPVYDSDIEFDAVGHPAYFTVRGPLVLEHQSRILKLQIARQIIEAAETIDPPAAVVVGSYLPMLQYLRGDRAPGVEFTDLLDRENIKNYQESNVMLYTVPFQDTRNEQVYGVNLKAIGARELPINQSE